ncbi:hypothetical protein WICPIJ_010042 [Wickerhamomyces pijperi]|uniref:Secreted protein n=1 Tax=Wickerhamomyces pijperi TaxID=599730 RepID=A0A9P8TBC6_WICPI|nr:hypothetical protein WICPIJ_010042 [Wickerhamomyces pijperi]
MNTFQVLTLALFATQTSLAFESGPYSNSTSASLPVVSATVTPSFTGVWNPNGAASFDLAIQAALGPWNFVDIDVSAANPQFDIADYSAKADGSQISSTPVLDKSGLAVEIKDNVKDVLGVNFDIKPYANYTGEIVAVAVIEIERPAHLVKRDDEAVQFTLTATATHPGASTSTATEVEPSTTVITITSCSDNKCHETPVTTGVTVVTTTIGSTETIYTTYCPLSSTSTATEVEPSTTVVTITSCSDNKCHESPVTTGVTVVTTTIGSTETIYTTYCPLSSTSTDKPSHPTTETQTETKTNTKTTASTTSTSTGHETAQPSHPTTLTSLTTTLEEQHSTVSSTTTTPGVSTQEGNGAGNVVVNVAGLLALALFV